MLPAGTPRLRQEADFGHGKSIIYHRKAEVNEFNRKVVASLKYTARVGLLVTWAAVRIIGA